MHAIKSAFEAIGDASSIARAVELNPSIDRSAMQALAGARAQLHTAWEELHAEPLTARVERDREGGATLLLMLADMFIWRRAKTVSWNLDGPRLTLNIVVAKDAAAALEAATNEQTKDDQATLANMSISARYAYAERQASRWTSTLEELHESINNSAFRNRPLPDVLRGRADLRARIMATAKKMIDDTSKAVTVLEVGARSGRTTVAQLAFTGKLLADSVIEYADQFFTGIA